MIPWRARSEPLASTPRGGHLPSFARAVRSRSVPIPIPSGFETRGLAVALAGIRECAHRTHHDRQLLGSLPRLFQSTFLVFRWALRPGASPGELAGIDTYAGASAWHATCSPRLRRMSRHEKKARNRMSMFDGKNADEITSLSIDDLDVQDLE